MFGCSYLWSFLTCFFRLFIAQNVPENETRKRAKMQRKRQLMQEGDNFDSDEDTCQVNQFLLPIVHRDDFAIASKQYEKITRSVQKIRPAALPTMLFVPK